VSAQVFKVDLRKYAPGICVGFEKMIVKCPLCGKGAYREEYGPVPDPDDEMTWMLPPRSVRYVHVGTLSNDGVDGLKWKREKVCRQTAEGEP
jgi:hypothetical protein